MDSILSCESNHFEDTVDPPILEQGGGHVADSALRPARRHNQRSLQDHFADGRDPPDRLRAAHPNIPEWKLLVQTDGVRQPHHGRISSFGHPKYPVQLGSDQASEDNLATGVG